MISKMNRLAGIALVAASVAMVPGFSAAAAPVKSQEQVWAEQNAEIDRYGREHPLDVAGLERLVEKYTGKKTTVAVSGVDGAMTGEQAQKVLDARRAEWARADAQGDMGAMGAVPIDAFNTSVQFIPVVGPPRRVKVRGNWDFRDNYVNGSAPDDLSSTSVKLAGCQRIMSTTTLTYDYNGNQTANAAYLLDSGLSTGAPVSGIRDRVSGFVTNFDHGFTEIMVQNDCAAAQIGAAYAYEHNQDSTAGFSFSAGWGFLSVNYTNATPALKKSSGPIYATI
jgi:hypothetical protein